ncbi:MAG: DUF4238 domain-containing protein [Zetaproteobacteria bacterium]|nr:DUF4238 domain-containing protein [Zetaproteobacteria bacterium]
MALDHYISQVHLKNFYSEDLGQLMYAINKKDQKLFTPNSKSVCRIENNSTNYFLKDERVIEEFLKGVEPKYNAAVSKLIEGNIDTESIYVISGFVAYVLTCSPAAMRIQSEPLSHSVEETAQILDKNNKIPLPPKELGGKNLSELLKNGKVNIEIDEKYPQAIGVSSILSLVSIFGNSKWEILINPLQSNPFFTSDFPVVIEKTNDPRVLNRIIPLTPTIAVRIKPDITLEREEVDFTFSSFRYLIKRLNRSEVIGINRLIVQCAEFTVFFNKTHHWVAKFVHKYSGFRVVPRVTKIPHGNGTLLWCTQEISKVNQ